MSVYGIVCPDRDTLGEFINEWCGIDPNLTIDAAHSYDPDADEESDQLLYDTKINGHKTVCCTDAWTISIQYLRCPPFVFVYLILSFSAHKRTVSLETPKKFAASLGVTYF